VFGTDGCQPQACPEQNRRAQLGDGLPAFMQSTTLITIAIILLQRHLALEDTVFESKF